MPEQKPVVRFTLRDGLMQLNEFTKAYIDYVASKEKNGSFTVDPSDMKILAARLHDLARIIRAADDKQPISARVNAENRTQLLAALKCDNCIPMPPSSGRASMLLNNSLDLRNLLWVRLVELAKMLEIGVERHNSYLREIVIAYLPMG